MIQTTLFNYFTCNKKEQIKQTTCKKSSFKQTSLNDYFSVIPKKKTIIDYFNPKEKKQVFDLVLIDLNNTTKNNISCIKKDMYEKELKYIAISYRWGELGERLLQTPDYTAHISSFRIGDLRKLCNFIKNEPDLKGIQYLWVDAISVDQQDHKKKKETILKMNEIYRNATYILAVPDLHLEYLKKNPANREVMDLIRNHSNTIYKSILNYNQSIDNETTNEDENEFDSEDDNNKEILKKAYHFLAYLVEDWSNRAWVISEYHIAKGKDERKGTPLKYIFLFLLNSFKHNESVTFFSYYFHYNYPQQQHIGYKNDNNNDDGDGDDKTKFWEVDNSKKFTNYLRSRFIQRHHINMLLHSNATRNEDRFNAILPTWKKYSYAIKNRNTISDWNITNMCSVRLKLFEIMDDLWDKARLLKASSRRRHEAAILPTFVSHYVGTHLRLFEKDSTDDAFKEYSTMLSKYSIEINDNSNNNNNNGDSNLDIDDEINKYQMEYGSIYNDNLKEIQLYYHRHYEQPYLSVRANQYFIIDMKVSMNNEYLSNYSLENGDDLKYVFIPFFAFAIPNYAHIPPINGSGVSLFGNLYKNRWILSKVNLNTFSFNRYLSCTENNSFNIF